MQSNALIAFGSLVVAMPLGIFFLWTINQPQYKAVFRKRRWLTLALSLPVPALLWLLYSVRLEFATPELLPTGFVALGPAGYLTSLYLLPASILCLANLEQIARGADEAALWEIKFLILGLAGAAAAVVYSSSKVLLYSFRYALLPISSLQVFPFLFVFTCLLTLASWIRSSGRAKIAVSQNFVYSTITLLSVGLYLVGSSLLARWISQWGQPGIEAEAILFLLSIVILGLLFFWTVFRHRAKLWIRRHIFAGRFDYRQYWMDATRSIRSTDSLSAAAAGLAEVTHRALGALDVTVWLRLSNPGRLQLLSTLGANGIEAPDREVHDIVDRLREISGPVSESDLESSHDMSSLIALMKKTRAELLVPLESGDRLVGLMTVGSNRSGRPYDHEAREFLRVLSGHAASEIHKVELLDTLVQAKEAEAFKSFASFVLHDLKNFASTLSMIAKNAARHQDNPEFQKDAFASVYDTAEKMKRLCNNLRLFSGSLAANKQLGDLNPLVMSAAKEFESASLRTVLLELNEIPRQNLDPEEILNVLQNLLLNAHQATPAEGTIKLSTRLQGTMVELTVEDNGNGMASEFLAKDLFLPFRTTKSDGLGIGLFQCKKIIEAHNGIIRVESRMGEGTIVRVSIPVARMEAETVGADKVPS